MKGHKSTASLDRVIGARLDRTRHFRHGLLCLGILALVFAWCLPAIFAASLQDPGKGVMTASCLPFLGLAAGFRFDETSGDPDGGGNLDPEAKMILDKIAETKAEMEKINIELEKHKDLKGLAEEFHKSVKKFDGLESDLKTVTEKSAKLEARLAEVRREVSGDPLKRLTQDPEMRALIVAGAQKTYLEKHNKSVSKEIEENAQRMAGIINGKALTGGATPGSTYFDDEMMTTVYQLVANHGKWANFDVHRPGVRTTKYPVDSTDPTMVWMTEGTAPSEASYAGATVTCNINTLFGWVGVSNELLEDDQIGLASHLAQKFARATSKKIDHAIFAADGTNDATHGDYEGIFNFGTAYDLATGEVDFGDVVFDDFVGLLAGADEALLEVPTSRWFCHPQILVQLLLIKDDNGRPLFLTALEAPAATGLGSILGYPVLTANAAPKTVAAEAPVVAFGDTMGMAVALRKDMEFSSSIDALFTANKTVFRQVARAGVKIKQATAFEVMTFGAAS